MSNIALLFSLFILAVFSISPVPPTLSDKQATDSTKKLMSFISSIYGKYQLSGQYAQEDVSWVKSITGKTPAIAGYDLMDYSPSRIGPGLGGGGGKVVEDSIAWARSTKGILTVCWHWNAPMDLYNSPGQEWWKGFYTTASSFDVGYAMANRGSAQFQAIVRDIDAIALQLKKYVDADIPLLWRPLHEAAGAWFWWGAKGADPFKQLWRYMYDRITNYHQIHNLIWVFTIDVEHGFWYPGDDVVDMNGMDIYSNAGDVMVSPWNTVTSWFDGKKILSLSESGTLPPIDQQRSNGVWWSWWAIWSGSFIRNADQNQIKNLYNSQYVLTVEEFDWRAGTVGGSSTPNVPTGGGCTDDRIPGDIYTCEQQASWGKCSEAWMGSYCRKSCGKC